MSAVAVLPTRSAVDAAWADYTSLVLAQQADEALRIDLDHNIAIVRAWQRWRDAFILLDARC